MKLRVGQGIDVHAFTPGDHVMLGGVRIPHHHGIAAHSDGDVALHAVCDALLGAAGMGDIGQHFPPNDPRWSGADSRDLLRRVVQLIEGDGWAVNNVDLTILCETPRVAPHVGEMKPIIAGLLRVDSSAVGIKATTTEQLGFCGRREGIAAVAVALLLGD